LKGKTKLGEKAITEISGPGRLRANIGTLKKGSGVQGHLSKKQQKRGKKKQKANGPDGRIKKQKGVKKGRKEINVFIKEMKSNKKNNASQRSSGFRGGARGVNLDFTKRKGEKTTRVRSAHAVKRLKREVFKKHDWGRRGWKETIFGKNRGRCRVRGTIRRVKTLEARDRSMEAGAMLGLREARNVRPGKGLPYGEKKGAPPVKVRVGCGVCLFRATTRGREKEILPPRTRESTAFAAVQRRRPRITSGIALVAITQIINRSEGGGGMRKSLQTASQRSQKGGDF